MTLTCDRGHEAKLVDGTVVYPHRPDLAHLQFWYCGQCDSWVGCHKHTTTPLGRLADQATRRLKQNAHNAFDPIWVNKHMSRSRAYKWLAQQLGLAEVECHIGMMSDNNLRKTVAVCRAYLDSRK